MTELYQSGIQWFREAITLSGPDSGDRPLFTVQIGMSGATSKKEAGQTDPIRIMVCESGTLNRQNRGYLRSRHF